MREGNEYQSKSPQVEEGSMDPRHNINVAGHPVSALSLKSKNTSHIQYSIPQRN